uniref:ATP synthase complex subunit 8 n=1 Tax=Neotermes sp. A TB-2014 TaxID=1576356 RepID=A0A0A7E9H4_9NEOP|nr:ATP synthase F0 subunit 8 [Neotermes sp. A TB-2014]
MPQMMPMSWLMLFVMFSMTLILFATTNYYTTIHETKEDNQKKTTSKTMNWKW